jgi:2',3'-cyclic-nucleotide 2'-phosphodiesterase (5'-nucleotidase family)
MPFDNLVTIVEVPGDILKQFCDHMAKAKGWPVSGITYTLKDKKASDIRVLNDPVNDHIIYKIAVSNYIANGGDNCDILTTLKKKQTNIFVRDAIINYVVNIDKQGKPLQPAVEKRVRYAE